MNAQRIVDEIEFLVNEYNVHDFEIFDDIFNLDHDRVMETCSEIKKRNLETRFSFPNGVRGDLLDRHLLKELRSVGTYHMAFAVESANPRLQMLIRKQINLEKIKKNIAIAAEEGIFTWGFFMVGFPSETRREIWRTIRFALKSKLHGACFFIVIPHEGTQLADMFSGKAELNNLSYNNYYHLGLQKFSKVGPFELSFIQSAAYLLFFFDPVRIFRIWRDYQHSSGQLLYSLYRLLIYLFYDKPKLILREFMKKIL